MKTINCDLCMYAVQKMINHLDFQELDETKIEMWILKHVEETLQNSIEDSILLIEFLGFGIPKSAFNKRI